jgi:hypothetical protein
MSGPGNATGSLHSRGLTHHRGGDAGAAARATSDWLSADLCILIRSPGMREIPISLLVLAGSWSHGSRSGECAFGASSLRAVLGLRFADGTEETSILIIRRAHGKSRLVQMRRSGCQAGRALHSKAEADSRSWPFVMRMLPESTAARV